MKNKGFTLTEMVVVVAIIVLLISIGIPAYLSSVKRAEIRNVANGLCDLISTLYEYEDKELNYDKYFLKINNYIVPDARGERYLTIQLISYKNNSENVMKEIKSKIAELESDIIVSGAGTVYTYVYYDNEGVLWRFAGGSPANRSVQARYLNTNKEIIVKARNTSGGYQKKVIIMALPPGSVKIDN